MPLYQTVLVAEGRNPYDLLENDPFVLKWNQEAAKHADKGAFPLSTDMKRFDKVADSHPPAFAAGHCFANALHNYKKRGLPIVVGVAFPKDIVDHHMTHDNFIAQNPRFHGYDHAWNLDKQGRVVDSTYHGKGSSGEEYHYYGQVVHPATASSFRNDEDVQNHVRQVVYSNEGRKDKQLSSYQHSAKSFHHIQSPAPEVHEPLTKLGFELHHREEWTANHKNASPRPQLWMYTKPGGHKLSLYQNPDGKRDAFYEKGRGVSSTTKQFSSWAQALNHFSKK
jgi:hypothetical protein